MKAFKATYKDQHKQITNIKPGVYMFQAHVYFESTSPSGKYSISLKDEFGVVYNINMNWQIEPNKWCEVSQQIQIEKKIVEFSLMASELAPGEIIHIGLPQHEEGTNKSTPRANPLDDTEEMRNEVDLAKSYFASEFEVLENRITLKVGQYRVGGKNLLRNYDFRFGMDYWSAGAEVVDETGTVIPVTVATITALNPAYVYATRTPEVPAQIRLNLDNGSSVLVPVAWGTIDTSVAGEFIITGTYSLPDGVTGTMPAATLKVIVLALTVSSFVQPAQVNVNQYRTPVLPATIQLNLIDDTSVSVNVSWGSYSTNIAGTFQITALYDFPTGVTGYKPVVKLTLVVAEVADTGTFVDLKPYLLSGTVPGGYPSGYTSGTDEYGDYVLTNANEAIINGLIPYINSTSILYIKITSVYSNQLLILGYVNSQPQLYQNFWFKTGTMVQDSVSIAPAGQVSLVSAQFTNAKVYFMELRNDGSIPPWFI